MTIDIEAEVERLEQLPVRELREEYAERCGEITSSRHRQYLIRRIAWRIQAQAEGGLTQRALQRAEALADDADGRVTPPKKEKAEFKPPVKTKVVQPFHDSRIPIPGTMLIRKYKRRTIRVLVASRPAGAVSAAVSRRRSQGEDALVHGEQSECMRSEEQV